MIELFTAHAPELMFGSLLLFLLTGFPTEEGVVITTLERPVPNGTRMA